MSGTPAAQSFLHFSLKLNFKFKIGSDWHTPALSFLRPPNVHLKIAPVLQCMDTVIAIDGFQADSFRRPEKVFRWLTWELLFLQNSYSCVFSLCVCFRLPVFFGQCMNTSIALGELFPIVCFETNPTADCWLPTLYNIKKYCPKTQNKQITRKYVGKCWNRPVEMLSISCPSPATSGPHMSLKLAHFIFFKLTSLFYTFLIFLALAFVMDISLC